MTLLAAKPRLAEWLFALIKTLFGAALVWGVTRSLADFPLRAGWIGMIGIMFVLHFGLLHAVSLAWQAAGVNAPPLMQAPILSVSTGEFWGARWNTGFHQLVKEMLFAPLRTIFGARTAVMVVFLASGLIHELLITVPARGGYGLPTLYFLLQGTAVLCERTNFARSCGLGRGWRGRLFTIAMTAGPAFWLFPPPFVLNVMIPFLKTIHSI
jgi:D-alanyl-lipoteichoic acid acyltransferase DltB (MBOAT superfamily)